MKNSYFAFKQFRIEQNACAMKVSTDGCLQGAWSPVPENAINVLDIGSGTGLLSLMLAQRFPNLQIDAIELDEAAARQAIQNINASSFKNRIQVYNGDVREFHFTKKYDYIICNPPFFHNDLIGPEQARNLARHGISLSLEDLLEVIKNLLSPTGCASILLPATTHVLWEQIITQACWFINGRLNVSHLPGGTINRICSICSRSNQLAFTSELISIKDGDDQYSSRFQELLRDFYLNL